jgi:4-hydroxymandelate oxidase
VNFHPEGVLAAVRAAARAGTAAFAATSSYPSIEDVRAGADCPLFFQLYIRGDRDWLRQIVHRAEQAGCAAIVPTVDTPAHSRLDRDIEHRFVPLRGKRAPNQEGLPEYSVEQKEAYAADLTWEVIDDLRSITKLPIILKGVMSPADAEEALRHGVNAIYVSNHGGRALNGAPATIEVLAEIVQAVAGRVEVIADSGFMRGTDVVKALALGARAVCIGKLTAFGLGAAGTDGVAAVLDILRDELDGAMAYLGARTIADLGPRNLRPATPPPAALWPYSEREATFEGKAATSPTSGV